MEQQRPAPAGRPTKPSEAQMRFITAILERGGYIPETRYVRGDRLFSRRRNGIKAATTTIQSCRDHGWVERREQDRRNYFGVTPEGRAAAEKVDAPAVDSALNRARLRMDPLIVGGPDHLRWH